jgi:hypothetical protein
LRHHPTRKGADFPRVSAGVRRQATGAGGVAELSARSQRPLLVRPPPPQIISVAGTAVVTLRWTPRPMGPPRPVEEVSSAGGAVPGRISQGRCPRLEPYEAKVSRTVLRGREGSNPLLLPDHLTGAASRFFVLQCLVAAPAGERGRSGATRGCRCYCRALFGVTRPAVLPAVSYWDMRHGRGVKLPAQRNLLLRGG